MKIQFSNISTFEKKIKDEKISTFSNYQIKISYENIIIKRNLRIIKIIKIETYIR